MKGMVIKTTGKHYTVKTKKGELLNCRLKGKFRLQDIESTNPIVVGDNVELSCDSEDYMIVKLFDRKNQILRKSVNLSKKTHVIAANIDQAILMITLTDPVTTTAFIDRFLVSAYAYNIDVILLFNKLDIYNKELLEYQKILENIYKNIGYSTLSLSVLNDNVSEIKNVMKGKLNMISGHSGVGKSTLINSLQTDLNINTQEISSSHNQGQHTTTFSQIYELNFGASVIDTPGIKGFGLAKILNNDLPMLFPEFLIYKKDCKYYNCFHKQEPDCSVKLALSNGLIFQDRYSNYLDMFNDNEQDYRIKDY